MKRVMIVEDSEVIREELKTFLEKSGYEVLAIEEFDNVIDEIINSRVDIVLLDITLPIFDGYYICRKVREKSNIPIIVVTSRDSEVDELVSINLGADDFITKPYNTQILLARVESLLKRVNTNYNMSSNKLKFKNLELNLENGEVKNLVTNKKLDLSKNEMKILAYLIKNKNSVISREDFIDYLWSTDYFIDDNTLSVNITRLRKKLESIELKDLIETKRGFGYVMEEGN